MSLDDLRKNIDQVDHDLLKLLAQRAELVHQVGEIKKRDDLPIYAPERENALLEKLSQMNAANGSRLPEKSIHAIYREIMSAALALEDDLRIAYLGPKGTWTHQAAIKKFGHSVNYTPLPNFAEVFDHVLRRKADYGVIPIENSTEGAVSHTLDLFVESPLKICAQILLRIENGLISAISREQITTLYSHPQVFGQCRQWILKNFPDATLIDTTSTTRAAELAKERSSEGAAALGGPLAAEIYGLPLLESSIQDQATNTTRFLVIGEKTCPPTGNDRTSLLFSIKDQPGSLVKALQAFDKLDINLSKIESRPSKQENWAYIFYLDLAGHTQDSNITEAVQQLETHCSLVKILGSYPNTQDL